MGSDHMKVGYESINHNAVRLIKDLLESRYDLIEVDKQNQERGYLLMTIGEIAGIIEMADAMKEVLKA
jgi:hypothetical protein